MFLANHHSMNQPRVWPCSVGSGILRLLRRDEIASAEAEYRAALYFSSASWQNRKACRTMPARSVVSILGLVRGRTPIWPAHVLDLAAGLPPSSQQQSLALAG